MLELSPARASVVRCFGERQALDGLPGDGAYLARVATDELWLVGPGASASQLTERAKAYLAGADPDGFVLDHGEAWSVWIISGPALSHAFARLADFQPPSGPMAFAQGAVAHLPAKILMHGDRLHVIVPVQLAHHLVERVIEACDDLAPRVGNERELAVDQ